MKPVLLASLLGLVACGNPNDDPAPPVAPEAKTHTLELSYWLASYGDAAQLPAISPLITVVLRPVRPGPDGWAISQPPEPLLRVQDVSTAVKKVRLPDVTTYAPGQAPRLEATVSVPVAPDFGPGRGYYVLGQYTVDGVVDTTRALYYAAQHPHNWDSPLAYTVEYVLKH